MIRHSYYPAVQPHFIQTQIHQPYIYSQILPTVLYNPITAQVPIQPIKININLKISSSQTKASLRNSQQSKRNSLYQSQQLNKKKSQKNLRSSQRLNSSQKPRIDIASNKSTNVKTLKQSIFNSELPTYKQQFLNKDNNYNQQIKNMSFSRRSGVSQPFQSSIVNTNFFSCIDPVFVNYNKPIKEQCLSDAKYQLITPIKRYHSKSRI